MKQKSDQLIGLVIKAFVAVLYSCSQFRLKRKVYTTKGQRIIDLMIGIIAFPVINGFIYLFLIIIAGWSPDVPGSDLGAQCISSLGPWIINGIFFFLAIVFRPYIGIGYIASFVAVITIPMIAGIFLVAGCFVIIILMVIIAAVAELSQSYPLLFSQTSLTLQSVLLFALCLGSLILSGWLMYIMFRRWSAKGK